MSPLHQFMIQKLIPIEIEGVDLSFTNSSLFMVVASILILYFFRPAVQRIWVIPNRRQASNLVVYKFIHNMVRENIGVNGYPFIPLILTLFLFIFMGNVLGMIPYGFTFTSHIIVTFALALFLFTLATCVGFLRHGLGFFRTFLPHGTPWYVAPILVPVEIISYFARPISLSVRLFANMMAGHTILKVFAGFVVSLGIYGGILPLLLTTVMTGFELLVAFLQAYVFAILSCLYLKDAIDIH